MLPAITLALSVEMLRDGGSPCAIFKCANGAQYWLLLPVILATDGSWTRLGYEQPVIVERSPGSGEIEISWEHAAIVLRQVVALLPAEEPRKWVESMARCIASHGQWCP